MKKNPYKKRELSTRKTQLSKALGPKNAKKKEAKNPYDELTLAEKTPLKIYLRDIAEVPLLNAKEERSLAKQVQKGNKEARERMIRANLRLVVKIAQDYNNFGLPYLDLISEGNIGLMKAIERFDPNRGGKLSTYAAWWIKQTIKRALANQSKTIRLPVHLIEKVSRLRKTENELQKDLKRDPTNEELGCALNLPVNKVAHLKSVSTRPASLDARVGKEENTELSELISDENATSPSEEFSKKSALEDIHSILSQLEERDATIIRMRFGLDDQIPKTLEDVGNALNITRERVRQLQYNILRQLRTLLAEKERQRNEKDILEEKLNKKRIEVFKEFIAKVERSKGNIRKKHK